MMPVIRVDDEVFRALQGLAEPLVDTPNTVLRRLLLPNKQEAVVRRAPRARPGSTMTPLGAFRVPILRVLCESGGEARTDTVLRRLEEQLGQVLTPADRQPRPDGRTVTWRNRAQWERLEMVKAGLLALDSPRGIWQITEEGRGYLARHEGH